MNNDVSAFVERYQLLYEKDPTSKVFAPLAEAYRRMGLLDEAIDLASQGVERHPYFASGRVALGKCYAQKGENEKAIEHLKAAVELSPENLLAHQLLAESYAKIRKPAEALNEFKMVLFLNPLDTRAAQVVKKLEEALFSDETLEADEEFSMERVSQVGSNTPVTAVTQGVGDDKNIEEYKALDLTGNREFERELALLDVRFDRGDWATVGNQLDELMRRYPHNKELAHRKTYLDELLHNNFDVGDFLTPLKNDLQKPKIDRLKVFLERIETRRKA